MVHCKALLFCTNPALVTSSPGPRNWLVGTVAPDFWLYVRGVGIGKTVEGVYVGVVLSEDPPHVLLQVSSTPFLPHL